MTKLKVALIAIGLIICNYFLVQHYPVIVFLSALLEVFFVVLILLSNFEAYFKVIIILLFIISNDLSYKLTTITFNDAEGAGVSNLLFIVIVTVVTVLTFSVLYFKNKRKVLYTLFLCLLIPLISMIYLSYFESLGLIDTGNACNSKEVSIKNKAFLKDLSFSDNLIVNNDDTIKILYGWAEKQVIMNHQQLLKRYDSVSSINYVIKLKSNSGFNNNSVCYRVNKTDINGASTVDSVIKFSCSKSTPKIVLTFFKWGGSIKADTIIKQVKIK